MSRKRKKKGIVQLTIFDFPQEPHDFKVGDPVRIKSSDEFEDMDILRKYYLDDYKHGNRVGYIKEIHKGKVISYCVKHEKGEAWVHADELVYLG